MERLEDLKYLGQTLTHQNSIQDEIKSRLKSGNVCCSVQNLLSSSLPSKNTKIKIYRTIILPLSLTWRVEHRLRVTENRVLRRILGPKRDEVTVEWRKLYNEVLNDLLLTQYSSGDKIEKNEMRATCSMSEERRGVTGFW